MTQSTTADRLQEKVWGVCLIAAPLLLAASSALWFNESTLYAAALTQMYAAFLFIPGVLGVASLLRHRAPRLAVFGGLSGILGYVGGVNFATVGLYEWAARTAGADDATVRAIIGVTENQLWPALNLPGITGPLTWLVLSIGLFRTGVVPKWVAVLLGIGAIAFPMGRVPEIQLLLHISDMFLLIPLAWIGLRYLTDATPSRVAVPATA
jgi:hypothetical protein